MLDNINIMPSKIINKNNLGISSISSAEMLVKFDECKICLEKDDIDNLVSPCECKGSIKYIHYKCLENSIKSIKDGTKCEICNYKYIFTKIFDSMKFLKIITSYSIFIMINFVIIILSLIYFINYRILLLLNFTICFFIINNVINYLFIDNDIQLTIKENILSHLLYSFIYQLYETIFNYKKISLNIISSSVLENESYYKHLNSTRIILLKTGELYYKKDLHKFDIYSLYFLFSIFFYIKFVYQIKNYFYNTVILNKL
jgi:hypothetical protein